MTSERVTLRDIMAVAQRLEDKFDNDFKDLDKRISTLEAFKNRALGTIAAFSVFSSLIAAYIWDRVVGKQ